MIKIFGARGRVSNARICSKIIGEARRSFFFFETNQAGELPIILIKKKAPRLGNNHTTHHANPTHQSRLDWDFNPAQHSLLTAERNTGPT